MPKPNSPDIAVIGAGVFGAWTAYFLQKSGAQLLDVRDGAEFAKGHLTGSLNIGLGGQYATWAGTLLDREKPIVIIAEPGREHEAALRLGRIGFDHVRGYLANGLAALASRADLISITNRVSPAEFNTEIDALADLHLLVLLADALSLALLPRLQHGEYLLTAGERSR